MSTRSDELTDQKRMRVLKAKSKLRELLGASVSYTREVKALDSTIDSMLVYNTVQCKSMNDRVISLLEQVVNKYQNA